MAAQKPSTKAGFRPELALTPDLRVPAIEAVRLDGKLDQVRESKAQHRLHMLMLQTTRLGNLVSSHQIEGLPVTAHKAQIAIAGEGGDALDEDLRRFARVYEEIHLADKPPNLSIASIRALHAHLFRPGTLDAGKPGEFKTQDNGVKDRSTGLVVFRATPWEDTAAEIEALLAWYNGDAYKLPPPVAAALFFVEFEAIHPFPDGNGRLGRLLNLVALRHFGLRNAFLVPIDTRFRKHRDAYYEALAATNLGKNYQVWVRFYLKELRKAYEEANGRRSLRAVLELPTKPSSRDLLEWIISRPDFGWFQRGTYPNEKELSGTALFHALTELKDLGLLDAEGERRARRYRLREKYLQKLLDQDVSKTAAKD